MQQIAVKTPQNVLVNLLSAGAGRRILAFLIDLFILFIYTVGITYLFTRIFFDFNVFSLDYEEYTFINLIYDIILLPAFAYSLLTEYFFNGQTLGKMALGIRVVKLKGYKAGFYEFFTRWIFRMVDIWVFMFAIIFLLPFGEEIAGVGALLLFYVSGSVAVLSIIRTKHSQRIGDLVAGTTVIKTKQKQSINITILKELKDTYEPKYPQVIKLSDNDARIIKDTFERARKNGDYKTIHKLRLKLEEVMEIKTEEKDGIFVDTVMKDFNFYTQKM